MITLKHISLFNYCGYKRFELDLSNADGVDRWKMFYGPNGIGKSNFIRAVDFLSNPKHFAGRSNALVLRKLKYHPDYVAGAEALLENVPELFMEGIFGTSDGDKKIVIKDNITGMLSAANRNDPKWISGVILNEFSSEEALSLYIDADHPLNMNRFQLPVDLKEPFLEFSEAVYGFKCELLETNIVPDSGFYYYTDFIITKPDGTRVHYKRFSDGEKKIATLIATLFKGAYQKDIILLVDNIAMHIYFKRHMLLIKMMEKYFPHNQILATTHSPIIIEQMDKKYLCDLEEYVI